MFKVLLVIATGLSSSGRVLDVTPMHSMESCEAVKEALIKKFPVTGPTWLIGPSNVFEPEDIHCIPFR